MSTRPIIDGLRIKAELIGVIGPTYTSEQQRIRLVLDLTFSFTLNKLFNKEATTRTCKYSLEW